MAHAADAVRAAISDGQDLLEVQLPSTAATVDSDATQAVNLRLAAAFGDDFVRRGAFILSYFICTSRMGK